MFALNNLEFFFDFKNFQSKPRDKSLVKHKEHRCELIKIYVLKNKLMGGLKLKEIELLKKAGKTSSTVIQ